MFQKILQCFFWCYVVYGSNVCDCYQLFDMLGQNSANNLFRERIYYNFCVSWFGVFETEIIESRFKSSSPWLWNNWVNITRVTLQLLVCDSVASHANENEMTLHNLAIVFGPTLMEPQAEDGNQFMGQTSEEIACIEDLLQYYGWLFDVSRDDVLWLVPNWGLDQTGNISGRL